MFNIFVTIKHSYSGSFIRANSHSNEEMKHITRFVNIILTMSCIFHVGNIINNILNPDLPEISVYKKELNEIDFPLSFLICIDQLQNDTSKYVEVGYKNVWKFYKGESMYNASITGWRGHTENGSKYDTVEGFF